VEVEDALPLVALEVLEPALAQIPAQADILGVLALLAVSCGAPQTASFTLSLTAGGSVSHGL
jgi:hypothetical protein